MEPRNLVQWCNKLKVDLSVPTSNTSFATNVSPEFLINNSALFQVMTSFMRVDSNYTVTYNNCIFVRFFKKRLDDELSYRLNFTSEELEIPEKVLICDDGTWHMIHESKRVPSTFDVSVVMETVKACSFASLHSDTELTDFELRGEDGSVKVHRTALAVSSPVLRTMLSHRWRETAECNIEVPGTSQKTLQHLKDYIYLQTLPDTGLEQILVLARYYMITDLEQLCVDKLVNGLTAQNACDLVEFAITNKVSTLLLAILDCVQSGAVAVKDIREEVLRLPMVVNNELHITPGEDENDINNITIGL